MSNTKPYRMRVRVRDGKPREPNRVKGQLVPHVDVIDAKSKIEFIICAVKPEHLDQVRAKLAAAGLEEIIGGETDVRTPATHPQETHRTKARGARAAQRSAQSVAPNLRKKPYGFVPLSARFLSEPPVWHDGTCTKGRLSGEVRCELETLTPLLVGWERRKIDDINEPWPVPHTEATGKAIGAFVQRAACQLYPDADGPQKQKSVEKNRLEYANRISNQVVDVPISGVGLTIKSKSMLCPLRAPWGDRPVIIPGDSLKGLLRHELGALLGAPMERVGERSYSYRPNSLYPNQPHPRLIPRLARIPDNGGIELRDLEPGVRVRVPVVLELFPENLKYDKHHRQNPPRYRFDPPTGGATYRGGLGAGQNINSRRPLHSRLDAQPDRLTTRVPVPTKVQQGYLNTLRHLTNLEHGHFSERHPDVLNTVNGDTARQRILEAAEKEVFSPGDLIWVEWDTKKKCIVSFGWHYYYRWAYVDTVRRKEWSKERHGLFPLSEERMTDDAGAPKSLSVVRRLFGYTGDNDGSEGIGRDDHEQLMGRISINAVTPGAREEDRFLAPAFLKELGMPRPSAVEFYLKQPYYPNTRPSDRACLVTYGDAAGYDEPGELAGRKFYLDRTDAYNGEPWKDDSEANRLNDRSTLALNATRPGRRFRFTVRFRDLDAAELAVVLLAFCPHQFREDVNGTHPDGYCSKLGYARPLGWGTIRIEAKELHLLRQGDSLPTLEREADIRGWFRQHFQAPPMLPAWLDVHRHKHSDAADYPRENGEIYNFHTRLRAQHTRLRRYEREEGL